MNESGYRRTIRQTTSVSQPCDAPDAEADLRAWLGRAAHTHGLTLLLAHSDVAVVWGWYADGALALSSDIYGPGRDVLNQNSLHSARLFGPAGELLLWRAGAAWKAHLITDGTGAPVEVIDEAYLLWGTDLHPADQPDAPFRLLAEGRQGIIHAPPVAPLLNDTHLVQDARLVVRHYLAEDDAGVARIIFSRLVNVEPREAGKGDGQ